MIDLLYIPALAAIDRLRGSQIGIGKTPEAIIYGLIVSLMLFGHSSWAYHGIFAILFLVGSSMGWGQPIGWLISGVKSGNYESWQIGFLKESPHLAVIVRGYLWALPTALMLPLTDLVVPFLIVMPFAFYLSALISHYTVKNEIKYAWEAHECLRGGLLAIGILIVKALS